MRIGAGLNGWMMLGLRYWNGSKLPGFPVRSGSAPCPLAEQLREFHIGICSNGIGKGLHVDVLIM